MSFRRFFNLFLVVMIIPSVAYAADDIRVSGGGWGHGIGMPQYGAQALADGGITGEEIVQHFYTGSSMGVVGEGDVTGHADPLRIGVAPSTTTQVFRAVGGPVTLCLGDDCSLIAEPDDGVDWRLTASGGQCQFFDGGAALGDPAACEGTFTWGDQPDVRVAFPDLGRTYARGSMAFTAAPNGGYHLLVVVSLEEYLLGIAEMPSSWNPEALRAQAIASRTYATYKAWVYRNLIGGSEQHNINRRAACGCHLYASTSDQKYIGWAKESEIAGGIDFGAKWITAVSSTSGSVAIHPYSGNRAIQAYFFSSTGGATENNEDRWGGTPFPYLRSVSDPGAQAWTSSQEGVFSAAQFAAALDFDEVWTADIVETYESGSPKSIVVTGLQDGQATTRSFTGVQFKAKLGLRSHYVTGISGLPGRPQVAFESDVFVEGDFDGDGIEDVATFSPDSRDWDVMLSSGSNFTTEKWLSQFSSKGGWTAVPGDFDGDGRTDVAVFHPLNGKWLVLRSTGSGFSVGSWTSQFSSKGGWTAVPGDFDGDGRTDVAVFHPLNGKWLVLRSTGSGFSVGSWTSQFSSKGGWTAVPGDFDGDGRTDVAVFHPLNGKWLVLRSTGSGFSVGSWTSQFSSKGGWTAVPGDFDGDGRTDVAVHHPLNGKWLVLRSRGSSFSVQTWTGLVHSATPHAVAGDFTGDGLDDVASVTIGDVGWKLFESNGAGFVEHSTQTGPALNSDADIVAGRILSGGEHGIAALVPGVDGAWVWIDTGSGFTGSNWLP